MDHRLIRTFIAIPVPESVFVLQGNLKNTIAKKNGEGSMGEEGSTAFNT